jgi:hypothetical protein
VATWSQSRRELTGYVQNDASNFTTNEFDVGDSFSSDSTGWSIYCGKLSSIWSNSLATLFSVWDHSEQTNRTWATMVYTALEFVGSTESNPLATTIQWASSANRLYSPQVHLQQLW